MTNRALLDLRGNQATVRGFGRIKVPAVLFHVHNIRGLDMARGTYRCVRRKDAIVSHDRRIISVDRRTEHLRSIHRIVRVCEMASLAIV